MNAWLAGDYDIVPDPRDIYSTRSNDDNAVLQPVGRDLYQRLPDQGRTDAMRKKHPRETVYTFWDYMRQRWGRDAGLRLDHLRLSRQVARQLVSAGVDRDVCASLAPATMRRPGS